MGKVINSHPAWARRNVLPRKSGKFVWPTKCTEKHVGELNMADITRGPSQEYWRQAPSANPFQMRDAQTASCAICGTPYASGAHFCHTCGLGRDAVVTKRNVLKDWLDLDAIRIRLGLSTPAMVFVLMATIFALATVMTGLVYDTSTLAQWQAVQIWRIEWLLATIAALFAALLFKTTP
jgi:hypothetical protein